MSETKVRVYKALVDNATVVLCTIATASGSLLGDETLVTFVARINSIIIDEGKNILLSNTTLCIINVTVRQQQQQLLRYYYLL